MTKTFNYLSYWDNKQQEQETQKTQQFEKQQKNKAVLVKQLQQDLKDLDVVLTENENNNKIGIVFKGTPFQKGNSNIRQATKDTFKFLKGY